CGKTTAKSLPGPVKLPGFARRTGESSYSGGRSPPAAVMASAHRGVPKFAFAVAAVRHSPPRTGGAVASKSGKEGGGDEQRRSQRRGSAACVVGCRAACIPKRGLRAFRAA